MATRNKPSLENLEAANSDQPSIGIPPGARVRVDFEAPVDPSNLNATASRYSDELRELAGEEYPDEPTDPLTEFLTEWGRYTGYPLKIVRLPDPADRRMPGQTYNRTRFGEIEQLGDTTFDPVNFVNTLQIINGNSGGIFRVWLTDQSGAPIPGARLDRLAISDPPKAYGRDSDRDSDRNRERYYQPQPAPVKPEPSALELRMQDLQEKLLTNALTRLLEPPSAPAIPPASMLSQEDQMTLFLVQQGGLLPNVVQKLTALAGSPEAAVATETWQERAINAAVNIAQTNPAIVERVSSTIERIVERILPNPQRQPAQQPARQLAPGQPNPFRSETVELHPLTPSAAPGYVSTAPIEVLDPDIDPNEDDDIMTILEDLFTLLSGTDPLIADHPTFQQLRKEYPVKFTMAMKMIAVQPLDDIIEWIKDKSPLYTSMLENPTTGPYYRRRLSELQILCQTPAKPQPAPAQPSTANTNDNSETLIQKSNQKPQAG